MSEVGVEVYGDNFVVAYTEGDNSNVVATGSMKNFVRKHALAFDGSAFERFLHLLGHAFFTTYTHMERVRLTSRELVFTAAMMPQNANFAASNVLVVVPLRMLPSSQSLFLERDMPFLALVERPERTLCQHAHMTHSLPRPLGG